MVEIQNKHTFGMVIFSNLVYNIQKILHYWRKLWGINFS